MFFAILAGRALYLQLFRPDLEYLSDLNSIKNRVKNPDRGYLYDRNNVLLVASKPEYDLLITPNELSQFDTNKLVTLLGIDKKYLKQKIEDAFNYSKYKTSIIYSGISKEKYAKFIEYLIDFKGFESQKRFVRHYVNPIGPNTVGYLSEVNERDIKKDVYYTKGDLIGVTGIEKSYEEYLRGEKGVEYLTVDVFNRYVEKHKSGKKDIDPIPGEDINVSIDYELQKYGEQLLKNKRGAIVAIEPETGEILALVSSPSFSPLGLGGKNQSSYITQLLLDSINKPLFDRTLLATYPPGSIFKPLVGLIALQKKVINPHSKFSCNHGISFGRLFIACHCGTNGGSNNLRQAIKKSCNSYFINAYLKTLTSENDLKNNLDNWAKLSNKFGLGTFLNNDLPTGTKGTIPNSYYYNYYIGKGKWTATMTLSNAIGQGEVLLTPIQMANYTAILANRGWYITPHIVKSINKETKLPKQYYTPKNVPIDSNYFKPITEGLCDVFNSQGGTSYWYRLSDIEICGKTGTSENSHGEDHSLAMAFAPRKNPKIAVVAVVENGTWGATWASPMVSLMIEKYLTKKIKPYRKPLEARMINGVINYTDIKTKKAKK